MAEQTNAQTQQGDENKGTADSGQQTPADNQQRQSPLDSMTAEQREQYYQQKIAKMDETIKRNYADAEAWRKYQLEQKPLAEQAEQREKEALERAEAAERKAAVAEAIIEYELPKEAAALLEEIPSDKVAAKAEELSKLLGEKKPKSPKPNMLQGNDGKGVKASTADQFADFMQSQLSNQ